MGLSRYSDRAADILGDRSAEPVGPRSWAAPVAPAQLDVRMSLPGSKSLTNRELVLSALADAPSLLQRPLRSRDTDLMADALRALGARIDETPGDGEFGPDWKVTPGELLGSTTIEAGLAGTVMRFVPPVAGLGLGPVSIDGDEAARRRPMRATVDSLRALGVDVADDGTGRLPFTIHGTGRVAGGEITIDASESSQFVSGLLLAAARFDDGLALRHSGERLPSTPHIDMTIASLAARGVAVDRPEPGVWVVPSGSIAGRTVAIEPDLSNAAPFLAATLLAGGSVTISGWPGSTTQVGNLVPELLERFGAIVTRAGGGHETGDLTVDGGAGIRGGGTLPATDLDLSEAGELAPTFVALAALADGPSTITGIGHLRGHETDRLAALVTDLTALGARITELPDGLSVESVGGVAGLHGGNWLSFDDHRMATTGALLGLIIDGVEIDDIGTTAKTLPEFPELWRALTTAGTGVV